MGTSILTVIDHERLAGMVKSAEDNVRFYWVPVNAVDRSLTVGSEPPAPPPEVYIL